MIEIVCLIYSIKQSLELCAIQVFYVVVFIVVVVVVIVIMPYLLD